MSDSGKIILHPNIYDQLKGTGYDENPVILRGKSSVIQESERENKKKELKDEQNIQVSNT